ncbi:MAG: restriction endonuclease subunit S [Cyclobacteriaceae bacterium]|nr:restriction endonuclease subunit S [Cyclobacteriaceae bacterium]MCB0537122.1 restriction endonuclease subunit S [Bacteroidota bacterium]MCW5903005.1 restriction endonuclease subunit S [Cyclobacteriaceae bacterium]
MMVQDIHTATWLSSVPQHWKTLRIKNLFDEIDERSETGEEELLSVSHYTGVTKKRDSLENEDDFISNAKTLVGYKKVAENDLVSNIMLAWNGSLGISKYEGITSPAYCVYRIKGDNNPHYYGYLFSTAIMKAEFRKKSFGIIDSRLRLYSDKFFSIPVAVPPRNEQDQIVTYIKAKSKKIKHFIQKKQAFIELLKEQRQAIISRAVIKGINPDVTLKDSGIQWLGDIPEHWEVRRIKNISSVISKGTTPSTMGADTVENGSIRFLKAENLYSNNISLEPSFFIDEETDEILFRSRLEMNDVLIVIAGATLGRTGIVTEEVLPANTNQAICFIRPKEVNSEFLQMWLQTPYISSLIWLNATQAAQPNLAMGKIAEFKILYPPINEQQEVVEFIKAETLTIDTAISKAEKEIELIKEYREAMIAEAVLGKLDVKVHIKKVLENAK